MTIIKIGGKVFKGLKWTKTKYLYKYGSVYVSGPFKIVPVAKGPKVLDPYCEVWVNQDLLEFKLTIKQAKRWCNNHAKYALVLSSRLVVIE